ncbi:MAG TPA: hypothetical protein VGE67_18085, partial [Haloferula sp.]
MLPNLTSGRVCRVARLWIAVIAAVLPVAGEEAQDYRFLGGEHLRSDRDFPSALREIIPIRELPSRIKFKSAWLSLLPDPSDFKGDYMVVYLVNDTDQPVPRAVGELQNVTSQMSLDGHWFPRDPL